MSTVYLEHVEQSRPAISKLEKKMGLGTLKAMATYSGLLCGERITVSSEEVDAC